MLNNLLVNNYKVYFITNDKKAFYHEPNSTQLHSDLKEELKRLKISTDLCELYDSLDIFMKDKIFPHLLRDENLLLEWLDIKKWILENLESIVSNIEIVDYIEGIDIEEPEIVDLEIRKPFINEDESYFLDDNREIAFISLTSDVLATIDAFMFKSDYFCLDLRENSIIELMDDDWNKHYVWIRIYPEAELDISLTLSIVNKKVDSYEGILRYTIYNFCKYCSAPLYSDAEEFCPKCGKSLF